MVFKFTSIHKCVLTAAVTASSLMISVPAMAQDRAAQFSNVLQQIESQKILIAHKEALLASQAEQISFLRSQIAAAPEISASVDEIVDKIAEQAENAVNSDIPFLRDERLARVDKLKSNIADDSLPIIQKYRQALQLLKIEVDYGFGVESYSGERPLNFDAGETPIMIGTLDEKGEPLTGADGAPVVGPEIGDFVRYGRMALVYLDQRGLSARRYDTQSKSWVDVKDGDLNDIRRAVRVAKSESAPAVLGAPVYKSD